MSIDMRGWVLLGWLVSACGGEARSTSAQESAPAAAEPEDPQCRTHDDAAERLDEPSGSCVAGATCRFTIPPNTESCQRGGQFYSPSPSGRACTCANGIWHCEVLSGGFGLVECPGNEPDGG